MLRDHGITDVEIKSVKGELTDHYHPLKKTVNLSEAVYNGRNAAAAAVAAHECGHAVQHANKYAWLQFRSAIVPLQASASMIMQVVTFGAMFTGFAFSTINWEILLWVIVAAYGAITLFSVVTLPVEFDATNRAIAWMESSGVTTGGELDKSKNALKWAASTYVIAAMGALATLLYYVALLAGGSD